VLCPVGDNLWLHRAVVQAVPGDVLVVQTAVDDEFGYWGEILSEALKVRGVAGLVIDGGVRDIAGLAVVGFPVFASRTCIRGTGKDPDAPGRLGASVQFGLVRVNAGDLIVADEDGVVAIPHDRADQVLAATAAWYAEEKDLNSQSRSGIATLELYSLPN
jgi:4-hydroxy-4-methyl-2-oxoglutarate aldolase